MVAPLYGTTSSLLATSTLVLKKEWKDNHKIDSVPILEKVTVTGKQKYS